MAGAGRRQIAVEGAAGGPQVAVDADTWPAIPGALVAPASPVAVPEQPARASRRDRLLLGAVRVADAAGLALAVAGTALAGGAHAPALATFALAAMALFQVLGLYARDAVVIRPGSLDELPRLLQALACAAAAAILLHAGDAAGATWAAAAALVAVPCCRRIARGAIVASARPERVLVLGSGIIAGLVATKVAAHRELGQEVVGCVDTGDENRRPILGGPPLLGTLADVERLVAEHEIDRIVITFSASPHQDLLDAVRRCTRMGLKVDVVPRLFEVIGSRVEMHHLQGLTLLGLRGPLRSRGALELKRAIDVVGAACALVLLAPLLLVTGVLIRCTSPGPVLFRQERVGRDQRPFMMLKFRTMVDDAEALKPTLLHLNESPEGAMFKIAEDPRVTRVGRFLRRTSLDELPQFVNVLRGEMSIVGPRPLIQSESDLVLGWHRTRLDITPGLTGPWQVLGRQRLPFEEMVKLDYLYVTEWSLWNDVKLALRTLPVMLKQTGV